MKKKKLTFLGKITLLVGMVMAFALLLGIFYSLFFKVKKFWIDFSILI